MAYFERIKYWCGVQVWKYLNLILMKLTRGADPNSIHFRMVYHLYVYIGNIQSLWRVQGVQ